MRSIASYAPTALLRALLPCLALAAMPLAAQAASPSTGADPAAPRHVLPKPIKTQLGRYQSREFIEVKFVDGSQIAAHNGRLSSPKRKPTRPT